MTLEDIAVDLVRDANSSQSEVVQPNLVVQSVQVPATNTEGVQFSVLAGKQN